MQDPVGCLPVVLNVSSRWQCPVAHMSYLFPLPSLGQAKRQEGHRLPMRTHSGSTWMKT